MEAAAVTAGRNLLGKTLSNSIDDYPDGLVIPVDKPYGWTSADVIRKIKWSACKHFQKKNLKVGHAGTLDPLATGVLLVCIGKATKLAEGLQREGKEYLAGITFGATTPSFDLEKAIDRRYSIDGVCEESLKNALRNFLGEQEQIAPLFSAKSVDGVRAYELARLQYKNAGKEKSDVMENFDHGAAATLNRQHITISDISLESFSSEGVPLAERPCTDPSLRPNPRINIEDCSNLHLPHAMVRIACSKGTYVRALARDIGKAVDSGAFLDSLRRTRSGGFTVDNALSVTEAISLFTVRQG